MVSYYYTHFTKKTLSCKDNKLLAQCKQVEMVIEFKEFNLRAHIGFYAFRRQRWCFSLSILELHRRKKLCRYSQALLVKIEVSGDE